MIRTAPSAVIILDTDGRLTMLNAHAEELLSVAAGEAIGRQYTEVFGPSLSERLFRLFLRSSRSGDSVEPQIIRSTLPDGRVAELRASLGPVRDEAGTLLGLLLVADEIQAVAAASRSQEEVTSRLREALKRYLGEPIATMVEERPSFIAVGGVRKDISVLHADIRGYTTFAEGREPEEVAHMLLRYHGRAVEVLQREGATLDRFIGDSVLALWNAPLAHRDHALAAVRGALAMQAAAAEVGDDLAYGIGVHSGDAVVGNVGSEAYFNYTAVGDTVNVAARLQAAAGPGEVVCSETVLSMVGKQVLTRPIGAIQVKGRKELVLAHRVEGLLAREAE
jgi:PAS domain S-box-containing protein